MLTYADLKKKCSEEIFVIGEAGVNHNGEVSLAKELVDVAVDAKCDAVKFQTWITDRVYSKTLSLKPEYQIRATGQVDTEYETIKKLELSFSVFEEIKSYCDHRGILFLSTPDEVESARFLVGLGVPFLKTASQDVTNVPFLTQLAHMGRPLIFSSGASYLDELTKAVEQIARVNDELIILHCVSSYPAPVDQMNLSFIKTLAKMYPNYIIGFSDHAVGNDAACAALAFGARVFEKHFTLDRSLPGPDHQASLEPQELTQYVNSLRTINRGLGDGRKTVMPCELNVRLAFRRFLVLAVDKKKGEVFTENDFFFKKTVDGITPEQMSIIVGKKAGSHLEADALMSWDMIDFSR